MSLPLHILRKRQLSRQVSPPACTTVVLMKSTGCIAQGVEYIYFIDEIFLPNKELLEGLAQRTLKIGVQTRIDLWSEPLLDLLGRAGCVSIEAGVESITAEGRAELDKKCKMSTEELAGRLIYAKQRVPFVQANLIEMEQDDLAAGRTVSRAAHAVRSLGKQTRPLVSLSRIA